MILKRVVRYIPALISRDEFITMEEASKILGISNQGIRSALNRGELDEYIDDERTYQGRRLVLRAQVEKLKKEQEEKG